MKLKGVQDSTFFSTLIVPYLIIRLKKTLTHSVEWTCTRGSTLFVASNVKRAFTLLRITKSITPVKMGKPFLPFYNILITLGTKHYVFRWDLIVLFLRQICFHFVMRGTSCYLSEENLADIIEALISTSE